ncbi:Archaeal ATPase [mine drainage metagenome]|uniref:Archaeal ATPase n=1 Tax=mine drainage metagenome TaxID=410659 RepID=T1AZY6_9ZZZZ
MSTRIIPRPLDVERINASGPWKMVYGRRKTGKSFMIKNFTSYDRFFFVNKDSTVLDEGTLENYTWSSFFAAFKELLGNKRVVIDEFHRLPQEFLDFLHASGVKGELVLITSTLWLAAKILGSGAPLVGLVSPLCIGLIDETDMLKYMHKEAKSKEAVEAAVYLREPSVIPQFNGGNVVDFISNYLLENRFFIRNLIGEIFSEEEKSLTNIYEGILKAVAEGKRTSTEMSSYLFSRSIVDKDSPSMMPKIPRYIGKTWEYWKRRKGIQQE